MEIVKCNKCMCIVNIVLLHQYKTVQNQNPKMIKAYVFELYIKFPSIFISVL